jgi:hypothetical protein
MKAIITLTILCLSLFSKAPDNTVTQCNSGSDATLEETKEWITTKVNQYGGRVIPPSRYTLEFRDNVFFLAELGLNIRYDFTDTLSVYQIELKDINADKIKPNKVGKENRFSIHIEPSNGKSKLRSKLAGKVEGAGFEVIITSEEPNLDTRMVKAFKHCVCLVKGGNVKNNAQEKF